MRHEETPQPRAAPAADHPNRVVLLDPSVAERRVDGTARGRLVLGAWRALCAVESAREILDETTGSARGEDGGAVVSEAHDAVARARRALRVLCEIDDGDPQDGETFGTRTSA